MGGYIINPKHCKGCIYARYDHNTKNYQHCHIYTKSGYALKPTPDENGRCIHKAKAVSK
jgi:hypothetical protein